MGHAALSRWVIRGMHTERTALVCARALLRGTASVPEGIAKKRENVKGKEKTPHGERGLDGGLCQKGSGHQKFYFRPASSTAFSVSLRFSR